MSISDLDVKAIYQGNGSTRTFAINFDLVDKNEARVLVRDETTAPATETLQVETTDFAFDTNPPTNITFVTAPTSNQKVILKRKNTLVQSQDFQSTGNFNPENAEIGLDKLTRIVQELNEAISRCAKLRETTSLGDLFLAQPEANKALGWNSSANALVNLTPSEIAGSVGLLNPSIAVVTDGGGSPISSTTLASEIAALGNLNASQAVATDSSGALQSIAGVSATELGYLSNVTSDIQSQINDAASSGGGAFEILPLDPSPIEVITGGFLEYEFDPNNDQIIGITFKVPPGFSNSTKDVSIDFDYSTPDLATNNTIISISVELYRPGTSVRGTPTDTTTVNQTIASDTTSNEINTISIDITSSGQVNATGVLAGDFILLRLRRDADNAGDTNTSVFRIIKSSIQVKVVDQ